MSIIKCQVSLHRVIKCPYFWSGFGLPFFLILFSVVSLQGVYIDDDTQLANEVTGWQTWNAISQLSYTQPPHLQTQPYVEQAILTVKHINILYVVAIMCIYMNYTQVEIMHSIKVIMIAVYISTIYKCISLSIFLSKLVMTMINYQNAVAYSKNYTISINAKEHNINTID